MPSWTEVQGYLRSRYRLQTDEAQHFVIGFALEGGGGLTGPLIQGVQGQLIEVEQHALLLLRAEVGSDRALNPVAALLHSSKLVLGGLTLLGNHYVLRYTVPLQGLQLADLDYVLTYLAKEAASLRTRIASQVAGPDARPKAPNWTE